MRRIQKITKIKMQWSATATNKTNTLKTSQPTKHKKRMKKISGRLSNYFGEDLEKEARKEGNKTIRNYHESIR